MQTRDYTKSNNPMGIQQASLKGKQRKLEMECQSLGLHPTPKTDGKQKANRWSYI
jgi:hypothetical protein